MTATAADIAKLTPAQKVVLGDIAIGDDFGHPSRVIAALIKKGLIEAEETKVYGHGNSPIARTPVIVTRYYVPLPVHIAWAEWCSTQVES